ncbi:VanW family protein [Candidatus Parcubacteria bacterium]|nr:VanW family protein [Candidatus Parcubacteria bacterium]
MKHLFRKYRKHLWSYIAGSSIIFLIFLGILVFRTSQTSLIYKNVYIGNTCFGGLSKEKANILLASISNNILEKGATLYLNGDEISLKLQQYAADPDLTREIIKFNVEETVNKLYEVGRHPYNPLLNLKDTIDVLVAKKEIKAKVEFEKNNLSQYFQENLKEYEVPSKNASMQFDGDKIEITNEIVGSQINYDNLISIIEAQLALLERPYAAVNIIPKSPTIRKYEIADRIEDIEQALARTPFKIKFKDTVWEITKADLKKMLQFEKINDVAVLAISKNDFEKFTEEIKQEVNVPAKEAKFVIDENGKVKEFQTSQLGIALDGEGTRLALNNVLSNGFPTINAVVATDMPKVTTSNANDLGISTLLGIGESDFSGSPANRVHNIKTGAEKLNGLMIKPGEEFSLITALGKIDGENGFKPELVIKEGRTVPEFGGGLCQIGTTVFRGAFDSGFEITERSNHSYRVGYYEPAGTDATIYSPAPDLKFKNDTPGYVLIQTKIEGTKLYFEYWGTDDGREVVYTKPVIYNITSPPAVKYIYTNELPAGQKKKLETAHSGADAYFEYNVKYTDGREELSTTFFSHYRPWAEVWLVGTTSTPEKASGNI